MKMGRKGGREEGSPRKNFDRFRKLGFIKENRLRLDSAQEEFFGDCPDKDIYKTENFHFLILQKEVVNGF